ncbi:polysaccharide biosynthesis protein [Alkalicoccus luteus]|uniref:Polysaccharide biosynthesis protein n=1 Tax=Alkalicoccus luteus TaxID=1237094 RepID=A0A969PUR2_9BACI|nr:nucleoside-diphosphate sugar epimerase/dehydratase [Alkalicoccus luteus]NJP38761.1 polysaccharide biosynthesis protein [Alkalicoccus luteus]
MRKRVFTILDALIIAAAFTSSFIIVDVATVAFDQIYWISIAIILISYFISSGYFRMNRRVWQYASIGEMKLIMKTLTAAVVLNAVIQLAVFGYIQYRVLFVTWALMLLGIGGLRFMLRLRQDKWKHASVKRRRTMIIGAGSAGTMLARQLLQNPDCDLQPVVFVDDDKSKRDLDILSLPVHGPAERIPEIAAQFEVERIIIAIPSLKKRELSDIYEACLKTAVKTQVLPMIEDLVTGKLSVKELRDVSPEDLLGREEVELHEEAISAGIAHKTILITGAGGSIGSELCRQIAAFQPERMILTGHGENSIYHIYMELKRITSGIELIPLIADVQDFQRMHQIMLEYRPHHVYHAAAHKHVPLMEVSPHEAVKNNSLGTYHTALAASEAGVDSFVMVSTDKAVNPTSVMGATKRLAEMLIHHLNEQSATAFSVVRFGNVLGSNGSVIPLFKKQIEAGGPVTVTHPEMIRYFMTIPEASRLVLQAGSFAEGGETFVLDMGEPVKIKDLAKNLIALSGYTTEDIPIIYTGIRPGEKLYEELLNPEEVHDEQIYPKIYLGKATSIPMNEIEHILNSFHKWEEEEIKEALLQAANRKAAAPAEIPTA